MNENDRTTSHTRAVAALVFALVALNTSIAAAQRAAPLSPQKLRLSLGDAARLAARQSAGVQGAEQRAVEARARVTQSRAALLPDLSANVLQSGRSFNTITFGIQFPAPPGQPPLFNPEGQVIGPVRTLDLRGRVQANLFDYSALERVHSAQAAAGAARADVTTASELAATQAAAAYLRTLRSDAQVQARVADSTLASELLSIAQSQLRAGVGVGLDVTRAQSQLADIRAQLISARSARERSRLDLKRALNLPFDADIELTDSLSSAEPTDLTLEPEAATARALRDRPDLRASEEQLRAARQTVSAIRAERLPTVSAFGDDGVIGKDASRLLPTYTYGIQLSVPIFDGFRREGRIEEQQAVARELEVRRRDLEQQASLEVRGALLDLVAARDEVQAMRERIRLAEQEVAQARERFRAGVAGNADVVTASISLNSARSQYVDALTALQTARVSLARAEGAVTQLR